MRIGVEQPVEENAVSEGFSQRRQEAAAKHLGLGPVRVDASRLHGLEGPGQRQPLEEVHAEHSAGHQARDGARGDNGVRLKGSQVVPNALHGRRLLHKVELVRELRLELRERQANKKRYIIFN